MTPTEGQTTTPSGADVLRAIDVVIEMEDSCGGDEYCGSTTCHNCRRIAVAFGGLKKARTAVAALIARNAELEAERDALAAERDKQQDTSREWAQRASALAAENKALQSRLSGLADHCRRVYDVVPQLPIDERSMEGATDARDVR